MKNFIIAIIIGYTMTSCLEVMDIKHDNVDPLLIVEGLITDQQGPHTIKLTQTITFNSSDRSLIVDDALVTLSDDLGNEEELQYTETGIYQSTQIDGAPGRTYYLHIEHGGRTYTSQSTMQPLNEIDTMYSAFQHATSIREAGYYVSLGAVAFNPNITNYYRWKIYDDDSLYNGREDIIVADDQYTEGEFEFQLGYPFEIGDEVTIEMYSMNKDALDYYYGFIEVILSDGGLFSPPPVNAPSNISNGALGLFQASSVVSRSLVIVE